MDMLLTYTHNTSNVFDVRIYVRTYRHARSDYHYACRDAVDFISLLKQTIAAMPHEHRMSESGPALANVFVVRMLETRLMAY